MLSKGLRLKRSHFRVLTPLVLVLGVAVMALAAEQPAPQENALSDLLEKPLALEWYLDSDGNMSLADMLSSSKEAHTPSFTLADTGAIPHKTGSVWFRLALPPYEGRSFYLDLNTRIAGHVPEGSEVWLVAPGASTPDKAKQLPQPSPGLFQLPNTSSTPTTVYLRVNGVPSPGFSPTLRESAHMSSVELDGLFWPCLVLGACFLVLLLRGIIERREWRLWSSLYVAAALTTLFLGVPCAPSGTPLPQDLPALLAPGIALLLLPHVGRQLLRSREYAPTLDIVLILTAMLGLALGLMPLLPQFGWTVRLLPLWPLGLCLLLPSALLALVRNLAGSRGFALAAMLPPLGYLPLFFHDFPGTFGIIKLMPAMALCASALILLVAPTPYYPVIYRRNAPPAKRIPAPDLALMMDPEGTPEDEPELSPFQRQLATLAKEVEGLSRFPVQQSILAKLQQLVTAIADVEASVSTEPQHEKEGFSLHQVVLEAHNAVSGTAEKKNLSLSWYMAPQLSRRYTGNRKALARVLKLLLESAVQSTERGTIQLRVQRMSESNDPGQVMFTVSDTGSGTPPLGRDTSAFCLAWELTAQLGGGISLTSGASGTTVVLAVRMQPAGVSAADSPKKPIPLPIPLQTEKAGGLQILVVSDIPASRQLLAYYLDELPHEILEARGTAEALAIYTQRPGSLVLFDADLPEEDVVNTVAELRDFEGAQALLPTSILALTNSEEQAERLRHAGCTRTLETPVSRTVLRRQVLRLAPPPNTRAASSRLFPVGDEDSFGKRQPLTTTAKATDATVSPSAVASGQDTAPDTAPCPGNADSSAPLPEPASTAKPQDKKTPPECLKQHSSPNLPFQKSGTPSACSSAGTPPSSSLKETETASLSHDQHASPAAPNKNLSSSRTKVTAIPFVRAPKICPPEQEDASALLLASSEQSKSAESSFCSTLLGMFGRKKTLSVQEPYRATPQTSAEWVGEPMPIIRQSAPETADKSDAVPEPVSPENNMPSVSRDSSPSQQPEASPCPHASPIPVPEETDKVSAASPKREDSEQDINGILDQLGELESSLRTARAQGDLPQIRHIATNMALAADALGLTTLADLSRCIEQEENEEALLSLADCALDEAREARN